MVSGLNQSPVTTVWYHFLVSWLLPWGASSQGFWKFFVNLITMWIISEKFGLFLFIEKYLEILLVTWTSLIQWLSMVDWWHYVWPKMQIYFWFSFCRINLWTLKCFGFILFSFEFKSFEINTLLSFCDFFYPSHS